MAGLFAKDKEQGRVDLEFMSEVDAALQYRGNRWAYRISLFIFIFFVLFITWTFISKRSEVTRGEGQITPSLGVQPIQSEQGGVIKEIFVKEGQEVRRGELLVQMSNTGVLSEYQELLNREVESRLSLRRLDAEEADTPLEYTREESDAYPDMVDDQLRLFAARKEQHERGTREIEANIEQKRHSIEEGVIRKKTLEETLLSLKQQVESLRELVRQRRYSEIEFIALGNQVISMEGELRTLAENIARTQSELREEQARLSSRDSDRLSKIAAERNEYRRQLDSITQRLAARSHMVDISDLRAPMNGVIRRILIKEENVAQRAEAIMELLPTDDLLEVDARFRPADRGFLEDGMSATVKVDAYDFTIYGGLPAIVTKISPDTIEDARGQAWYEVRLQTESSRLMHKGQELEIKPGMTVTVDVISGEKSIFDYLMKPILKSRQVGKVRSRTANATEPVLPGEDAAADGNMMGNGL